MYVMFENDMWFANIPVRPSLFEDLKRTAGWTKVLIKKGCEQKMVCIKELEDYSIYRNINIIKIRNDGKN